MRVVDLERAKSRDVVTGPGYLQVVALADGLALVRSEWGRIEIDTDDPDTRATLKRAGQKIGEVSHAEVEPALYLIDARNGVASDKVLRSIIPCRAGAIYTLAGGRIVAIWTPHERAWRTAILSLQGEKLGLVTTMKEALPDLLEVDARAVSSNAVELVNADVALRAKVRALSAIAPGSD
jgi:hypothetical protein